MPSRLCSLHWLWGWICSLPLPAFRGSLACGPLSNPCPSLHRAFSSQCVFYPSLIKPWHGLRVRANPGWPHLEIFTLIITAWWFLQLRSHPPVLSGHILRESTIQITTVSKRVLSNQYFKGINIFQIMDYQMLLQLRKHTKMYKENTNYLLPSLLPSSLTFSQTFISKPYRFTIPSANQSGYPSWQLCLYFHALITAHAIIHTHTHTCTKRNLELIIKTVLYYTHSFVC